MQKLLFNKALLFFFFQHIQDWADANVTRQIEDTVLYAYYSEYCKLTILTSCRFMIYFSCHFIRTALRVNLCCHEFLFPSPIFCS